MCIYMFDIVVLSFIGLGLFSILMRVLFLMAMFLVIYLIAYIVNKSHWYLKNKIMAKYSLTFQKTITTNAAHISHHDNMSFAGCKESMSNVSVCSRYVFILCVYSKCTKIWWAIDIAGEMFYWCCGCACRLLYGPP